MTIAKPLLASPIQSLLDQIQTLVGEFNWATLSSSRKAALSAVARLSKTTTFNLEKHCVINTDDLLTALLKLALTLPSSLDMNVSSGSLGNKKIEAADGRFKTEPEANLFSLLLAKELRITANYSTIANTFMVVGKPAGRRADTDAVVSITMENPFSTQKTKPFLSEFYIEVIENKSGNVLAETTCNLTAQAGDDKSVAVFQEAVLPVLKLFLSTLLPQVIQTIGVIQSRKTGKSTHAGVFDSFYSFKPSADMNDLTPSSVLLVEFINVLLELITMTGEAVNRVSRRSDWLSLISGRGFSAQDHLLEQLLEQGHVEPLIQRGKKKQIADIDIPQSEVALGQSLHPMAFSDRITVMELIRLHRDRKLIVPDFQRKATAWSVDDKRSFITDLITLPNGFYDTSPTTIGIEADETKFDQFEYEKGDVLGMFNSILVDGLQRLTAILDFVTGVFGLKQSMFTSLGEEETAKLEIQCKASGVNSVQGIRFHQMSKDTQERFLNTHLLLSIRVGDMVALSKLFSQMNLGKPLLANEIAVSPFNLSPHWFGLIKDLSNDPALRSIRSGKVKSDEDSVSTATEELILKILSAFAGSFTNTGKQDYFAAAAAYRKMASTQNVSRMNGLLRNLLDFLLETQVEEKFSETMGAVYVLSSGDSSSSVKPLFFIYLVTVIGRVVSAYCKVKGIEVAAEWAVMPELEWLFEQRKVIWDVRDIMAKGHVKAAGQPLGIRVATSAAIEHAALPHIPFFKIPFDSAAQWVEFYMHLYEVEDAVGMAEAPKLATLGLSDEDLMVFLSEGFAAEKFSADDVDELSKTIVESIMFQFKSNETTVATIYRNLFSRISKSTNGVALHTALQMMLMWNLFHIILPPNSAFSHKHNLEVIFG
jgi:hypothetical protein